MTALALMVELKRQGVQFIDDNGTLRVITPKGVVLSATLKSEIRQHRADILRRLHLDEISPEMAAAVFPGSVLAEDVDFGTCARCAGQRWWLSRYGIKVCGDCFPPSTPSAVVAWVGSMRSKAA